MNFITSLYSVLHSESIKYDLKVVTILFKSCIYLKDSAFAARTSIFGFVRFDDGGVSKQFGGLSIGKALFEASFAVQFAVRAFIIVFIGGA